MTLKVGDRVRIKESSEYYGYTIYNPSCDGTIRKIEAFDLGIRVDWDNGLSNDYNEEDLELID